jgi:hypothetical protein
LKRILGIFFHVVIFFAAVNLASAHGGGDLIARSVQAGPYTASIWVNPPDPRANETIHFTVGLASPEDSSPVLDADIQVVMRLAGREEIAASAAATTEKSVNRLFYETDIEVAEVGDYEVDFQITGADGGGTITLNVDVQPESGVNWLLIGFAGLGLVLLLGWWRSRRKQGQEYAI